MLNKKNILAIIALSAISLNTFATGMTLGTGATSTGTTSTGTTSTGEVVNSVTSLATTTIDGIEFVDSQTLTVKLSNTLNNISDTSEAKALEDVKILDISKDIDNAKKIKLTLDSDLIDGTNYSIISVSEGLDTSIDFNLSGDKLKIVNSDLTTKETGIEYISVIDPKTVEIYLNKELTLQKFEFKMFKEVNSQSVFADSNNLNIKLNSALAPKKDYILILTLKDGSGNDIEVENSLYDFTTPEFAVPETTSETLTGTSTETSSGELTQSGSAIENVAANATQTPDTGTKTNVLLFLTFILTLSIFLLKRKSLKM